MIEGVKCEGVRSEGEGVTGVPPLQSCSFFNSNAVPLKLSFVNADALGSKVNVLFKMGDDLRQDILILQVFPPSHPHTFTPPLTNSDL